MWPQGGVGEKGIKKMGGGGGTVNGRKKSGTAVPGKMQKALRGPDYLPGFSFIQKIGGKTGSDAPGTVPS